MDLPLCSSSCQDSVLQVWQMRVLTIVSCPQYPGSGWRRPQGAWEYDDGADGIPTNHPG